LPEGTTGQIEVAIDGEGEFLEPTFTFVSTRPVSVPSPELRVPLDMVSRERRDGTTFITLRRPRGVEPTALVIGTSTPFFRRSVVVRDDGLLADGRRIHSVLRRSDAISDLRVEVPALSGDEVVLDIDDGDESALTDLTVTAVVRAPELVFHWDGYSTPLVLRFGGRRVPAPRYPVGELLAAVDLTTAGTGVVGAVRESGDYSDQPALADLMKPGRPFDPRAHRFSFAVDVPASREGLARIPLTAEVFASAREDLGDLRVVDGDGAQWPYLIVPNDHPVDVEATVTRIESPDGVATSRYRIAISPSPLPIVALELDVRDAFVQRDFVLVARRDGEIVERLSGPFVVAPDRPSRSIAITLAGNLVDAIEVDVQDGDENPVRIARARLSVSARDLFLVAPEGRYALLAGARNVEAPVYDLQRARALVLVAEREDASLGPREDNGRFEPPSAWSASRASDYAVWIAVIAAVLILGVLTFRLARTA
jgi:hypothetical protein